MPKIQAYKGRGKLIPVTEAKTATAYQCPFTNDVFSTKRSYVKHLKTLRTTRMHQNARQRLWQRKMQDLWNQSSFENIVKWIELNLDVFWQNGRSRGWHSDQKEWDRIRDDFWIRITYLDVRYSDRVSNTHACPHTGVTNWGLESGKPTGYPGWSGRIEYQLSHDVPSFGSDIVAGTRIHTGTGGGISDNRYGFDVKFFADDWPGLVKRLNFTALQGNSSGFGASIGDPRYFRH